ncbi:MAG: mechanosensitive ion channel domain-containing protein [Thermodesulfobacteriota bacterium]
MNNADKYADQAITLLMTYGPQLLLALLTLVIGWKLIKVASNLLDKAMDRHNVDLTLQKFVLSITSIILKIMLLISVASMVGIATTSLIALLGAAGLAVGLALQGSLSNFAGSMVILFFKPFAIGDIIEAQGYTGKVQEIQMFTTIINTPDNQKVIIPNGLLSNGCIKNIFVEKTRRVDLTFGISYEDDLVKAKEVLGQLIAADARALKDQASEIYIAAHADSSVNILVRIWVKSEDYWDVYFDMLEQVKLTFDRENITIPYPQRDVHLIQQPESPAGS